ncbi:MAG: agmatinase family protein [Deltaproteobacteria bacterium]|nr:agmatinase family protein [Deltaproteobacteria bacterium]
MGKKRFDPNSAAEPDSGIFGLPYEESESKLVYLPVPWEATTSYGEGTADGPAAILAASAQLDLFDLEVEKPYEAGFFMLPENSEVRAWNEEARGLARKIIASGGRIDGDAKLKSALARVNALSEKLNGFVRAETRRLLAAGKIAGIVGGDHSCPLGAFEAAAESFGEYGILHFDAHSDTRDAFEGFTCSHASIMRNALDRIPKIKKLTQVGIRDFCEEEHAYVLAQKNRASVFYDLDLQRRKFQGAPWATISKEIIDTLPRQVWISFDIDALDPRFCPHTGTPVPGGLDFSEAVFLIRQLATSGRKILGFDLCEVAPDPDSRAAWHAAQTGATRHVAQTGDEWDANVGMRLLYKLSAWTLASQAKKRLPTFGGVAHRKK